MLKQRVITAVALLAILLGTLLAPSLWPLVVLLTVTAGCALWEWLRLTWPEPDTRWPAGLAVASAVVLFCIAYFWLEADPAGWAFALQAGINRWLLPAVVGIWVFGATALVMQGQSSKRSGGLALSLFAFAAMVAVWAALVQIFIARGAWYLVSLMALIWFADIAAYFTGKAFGRHKLAPRVSPGKTWEGAVGGVAAATLWIWISSFWAGSFGAELYQKWPWWGVVLVSVFLAALSIVGDLFESLLKRRAGVKDSSQLLPGHGGAYDRIDALLPVAPLAMLMTGI
ncbi:phosphatidate cytidylyltransferase [Parapusillimonas sp. JC17]|uniref:phosphatidate cytidylyltransferase n=1 Tax=Parapusillimonas sp. JC17 TaxID=3445768 RepID=UPI003FA11128